MVAIVTDSSVYITKKEAKDLGIRIAPMTYTVSGQIYNENYSDCNGAFENLLAHYGNKSQTAQTNISVFMSTFDELLRQGYEILCLTISSRLSGTYSSASLAAKEVDGNKILVVDSLTTAGGLYMLARYARELANAGLSLAEIGQQMLILREKIEIAFSVDDMEPLRRSGRLGLVRQSIGTILNVRPLLMCVEGSVISDGIARGRREMIRILVGKISRTAANIVVHCITDTQTALEIMENVRQTHPRANVELRRLGPVLGIHLGLGVVGIAWLDKR